jgi:hypothetical protein
LDPSPTSINQQNPAASRRRMPHKVVDMLAANVNVMKKRGVAISALSHGGRHRKRDEKSDGRKEKPAFRPITHTRVKQIAEARVVQEQEEDRDRQKNLSPDGILRAGRIEEVHVTGGGKKRLGAHFCIAK